MSRSREPVTVTTTTHATVISWYVLMATLGLLHLLDIASHTSVTELVGDRAVVLWSLLHHLAGLALLVSALVAARLPDPRYATAVEALACLALAGVYVIYTAALWGSFGAGGVVTTQVLGLTAVLGGGARAVQIAREHWRIRRAMARPAPADPAPLAEASGADH